MALFIQNTIQTFHVNQHLHGSSSLKKKWNPWRSVNNQSMTLDPTCCIICKWVHRFLFSSCCPVDSSTDKTVKRIHIHLQCQLLCTPSFFDATFSCRHPCKTSLIAAGFFRLCCSAIYQNRSYNAESFLLARLAQPSTPEFADEGLRELSTLQELIRKSTLCDMLYLQVETSVWLHHKQGAKRLCKQWISQQRFKHA